MANEYLINKWRLWFRSIDINHMGQITREDVNQEGDTFANLSKVNAKRKKEIQDNLHKLWNEYVFRGKSGPVNEEDFVQMNINQYKVNKEKFREGLQKGYTALFSDIIDVNHEGFVTEEEFVNILKACGHENEAKDKKFFSFYNPVDGKVPLQVLIDSWVQFTTSDDDSTKDVVKEALESGI